MQFSWSIALEKESSSDIKVIFEQKLVAEVVFGISSQGCRGTGICKLTTLTTSISKEQNILNLPCKKALVVISKQSRGKLCFEFKKSSICKKAAKENFANGYFLISEDFEIPYNIQIKLNVFGKIISKGLYPVIETKETFTVIF